MIRIPYFDFYPSDFMHGVRGLSAQEVGVYTMMLCRIYEENGPVEYHILRLSTYCGMRSATFVSTLQKLVDLGKLEIENGMVLNRRALAEISSRADKLKLNSKAGKASAEKRQLNQQNNSTHVQRTFNHTDTDTDTDTIVKIEANASTKKTSPRGCRIPIDFKPDLIFAESHGLSKPEMEIEAQKFANYWKSKSSNATKINWQATWQNWVLNAVERKPTANRQGSPPRKQTVAELAFQNLRENHHDERFATTDGISNKSDPFGLGSRFEPYDGTTIQSN